MIKDRAKKVSEQEHKEVSLMVDCLLLVSMVDRYFVDFEQDIKESIYYKHKVKHILPMCSYAITKEHNRACKVFSAAGREISHGYIVACDTVDAKINKQIAMNGIERSSTILQSVIEMIECKISSVKEVCTADFDTVCKIVRRFTPYIPMKSNDAIKFIIEEALKKRLLNNVNE